MDLLSLLTRRGRSSKDTHGLVDGSTTKNSREGQIQTLTLMQGRTTLDQPQQSAYLEDLPTSPLRVLSFESSAALSLGDRYVVQHIRFRHQLWGSPLTSKEERPRVEDSSHITLYWSLLVEGRAGSERERKPSGICLYRVKGLGYCPDW